MKKKGVKVLKINIFNRGSGEKKQCNVREKKY